MNNERRFTMYYFNDLTGKAFGKLTVIRQAGRDKSRRIIWLCKCQCGKEKKVNSCSLVTNNTKSCGCEKNKGTRKYGAKKAHDMRTYNIWIGIKDRCLNPKNQDFSHYGGRGITICEEWLNDFQAFNDWALANGYKDNLTIDRIDVNKGYSPENCRWADMLTQANNRTNSHLLTFQGEAKTISEWARTFGINDSVIRNRLCKGWSLERTFLQPVKGGNYGTRNSTR